MKKHTFNTGAVIFLGTMVVGPAFATWSLLVLGLLAIGFILILIGLFPDDSYTPTEYPAGSYQTGGEDAYNELAESGAFEGSPTYGKRGDPVTGYRWTGHDANGKHAEYITWFQDRHPPCRERVK